MKKQGKIITTILAVSSIFAPIAKSLAKDIISDKVKQKIEQEKIYVNQKRNGWIKYASIIFSLVALFLTVLAFNQSKIILGIIGLLAVIAYVITFLYCLEIIKEKKHNTYKIAFIIGDMIMVIVATLLFF